MHRAVLCVPVVGSLLACAALGATPPIAAPVAAPYVSAPPAMVVAHATAMEARFVALVNRERTRRGLNPLTWDGTLCLAGRQHSDEMARLGYFDHTSPVSGLETPADRWERCAGTLPDSYTIAENLFYGSVPDVAWGHRSLMESAGHRENILNPEYTRVGVGVHVAANGEMWVTEMFRT